MGSAGQNSAGKASRCVGVEYARVNENYIFGVRKGEIVRILSGGVYGPYVDVVSLDGLRRNFVRRDLLIPLSPLELLALENDV